MDQSSSPLALGLGIFVLYLILGRRSHQSWPKAIVTASALGLLYGVGSVVMPNVGRALGIEIVGLVGLIALTVVAGVVIYTDLRKEDSRL